MIIINLIVMVNVISMYIKVLFLFDILYVICVYILINRFNLNDY